MRIRYGSMETDILFLSCGKQHGMLASMRVEALKTALSEAGVPSLVYTEKPYVSVYYYEGDQFDVAFLVNFSDDQYREIALNGVNQFKKVQTLSRDNGTWQDVETNSKGHKTIIKTTLSAATTVTLKIFKE